jgi:hypothetical protein
MVLGLVLDGSPAGWGVLHRVADLAPQLVSAPWVDLVLEAPAPQVVACAELDSRLAATLEVAGVPIVDVEEAHGSARLAAFGGGAVLGQWPVLAQRRAPSILEAVRPVRDEGAPVAAEVLLVCDRTGPAAARVVAQLLAHGRHDVAVSTWTDGEAALAVFRVPAPPYYLLLRATEEPHEGVRAYAPSGTALWVEWGYRHPLAPFAARAVPEGCLAVVDRTGRWGFFPREFAEQSIFDVVAARLEGRRATMTAVPGETHFEIPLALAPGNESISEAWVFGPDDLLKMEAFVHEAAPEEIAAFTIARLGVVGRGAPTLEGAGEARSIGRPLLATPPHALYLLEERAQPSGRRVGSKIDDLLGCSGFFRWPTTENLYVRVGHKLTPPMRRTELAKVLALDDCYAVLVDLDRDGPLVYSVRDPAPAPLSSWLDYCSTDRRLELDRLLESSVFELPIVRVAKAADLPPSAEVAPPPPSRRPKRPLRPQQPARADTPAPAPHDRAAVDQAILERLASLEKTVSAGGCDDVPTWREIAELKEKLARFDEAAAAWEAVVFHGAGAEPGGPESLARARAAIHGAVSDDHLLAWVTEQATRPGAAQLVGARALTMMARQDPLMDLVGHGLAQLFTSGRAECSRRLAWSVLRAYFTRARDALGLTRAKQALIGQLNTGGLDETYDVPAFVRMQLALDSPDAATRDQAEQALAVEQLWEVARRTVQDLDVDSAYRRALFACGFARAGLSARAAQLARQVEAELPAFEQKTDPTSPLLRLYLARLAAEGAGAIDPATWEKQIDQLLPDPEREERRRGLVEWLRRRSTWLCPGGSQRPPGKLSTTTASEVFGRIDAQPEKAGEILRSFLASRRWVFDYEIVALVEHALRSAMGTGDETLTQTVLSACMPHVGGIAIAGHRAVALGACLSAAAMCNATDAVESLVTDLLNTAQGERAAPLYDLVGALEPGLSALRRTGRAALARSLVDAFGRRADEESREALLVRVSLADAYLQLGDRTRAAEVLDSVLSPLLSGRLDYIARYEVAAALLKRTRAWPVTARVEWALRLLENLAVFQDTFTTRTFYATHRILLLEHLLDAVTDLVTVRADRRRGFLEADELAIRRRILADWRAICGP